MPKRKIIPTVPTVPCDGCKKPMPEEDVAFWGRECSVCRMDLPLGSSQCGDDYRSGAQHDRTYHGGSSD